MKLKNLGRRLADSLRDPHMRANVLALAGGKMIGLTLLLSVMSAGPTRDVRDDGNSSPGVLGISVCVRRHVFDEKAEA